MPLLDMSTYAHRSYYALGYPFWKPVESYLDRTRPVAFKIWSCLVFNEQDLIVKVRASTLEAHRKKLTTSVLMGFVFISILCLKQWFAFITFVTAKNYVPLSVKRIYNLVARTEILMHCWEFINRRKFELSLKGESMSDGHWTKQKLPVNNISENTFLSDVHLQLSS